MSYLMQKLMNIKKCGTCGKPVDTQVRETRKLIKAVSVHPCTLMKGICKIERTYIKKRPE